MAEPVAPVFKAGHSNEVMLEPGNTNANPLPVFIVPGPKTTFIVSKWKLSASEIAQVLETGEIFLVVEGQHPPVVITPSVELHDEGVEISISFLSHNVLEDLANLEDTR